MATKAEVESLKKTIEELESENKGLQDKIKRHDDELELAIRFSNSVLKGAEAAIIYRIKQDKTVEITYDFANNGSAAILLGRLLFLVNNGVFLETHTEHLLEGLSEEKKAGAEVALDTMMELYETQHEILEDMEDSPLVGPLDVFRGRNRGDNDE